MLQVETPFPHAGSHAFVVGTADPVRIIQRNADATCTVQRLGQLSRAHGASRTLRVPQSELVGSAEQALSAKVDTGFAPGKGVNKQNALPPAKSRRRRKARG